MENSSSSTKTRDLFTNSPINKVSESERLHNWHCDQELRVEELKHEIERVTFQLEKQKQEFPSEKLDALRTLNEKLNKLRAEYHSLSIQ